MFGEPRGETQRELPNSAMGWSCASALHAAAPRRLDLQRCSAVQLAKSRGLVSPKAGGMPCCEPTGAGAQPARSGLPREEYSGAAQGGVC